jgi:subtilisin family serine protease
MMRAAPPWLRAGTLRLEDLRPATGLGVRIAVIDSGVHAAHPHIGGVTGGVSISETGELGDDFADRLGHGTAVTAAIREKAPGAEVWVARVFDRRLDTTVDALVAAIRWAVAGGAHLVNLSLGTSNQQHVDRLQAAVAAAAEAGVRVVAAGEQDGVRWLPGSLDDAVSVALDWTLPRETCVVAHGPHAEPRVRASGYPRPIPGVDPERNLKGLSFAVANATGLLALVLEQERVGR